MLTNYVTAHDFSKLLKPTFRNPLIADKGKIVHELLKPHVAP